MSEQCTLGFPIDIPVRAANAGLFVSQGKGRHPTRVIDSYEIIFVRQGVLGMREGNTAFDVHAGQTLLLWPGREHGGTHNYLPDLRFYWLHFTVEHTAENTHPLFTCDVPQLTTVHRPDRLTALFRQFLDDQETGRLDTVSGSLLVMQLLAEVAYAAGEGETIGGAAVLLAQRAATYIQEHYSSPISTSSIAAMLDSNADYLGRVFAAVYGRTITEAIHQRRIHHARLLLLDSDVPVEHIARECGFEDVGYFRRVFRRLEGMTPLAYRRLYARVHINTR